MTAHMPRSGEGCLGSRGRPSDARLSSGLLAFFSGAFKSAGHSFGLALSYGLGAIGITILQC